MTRDSSDSNATELYTATYRDEIKYLTEVNGSLPCPSFQRCTKDQTLGKAAKRDAAKLP